ncbi:MAG: hypothetical protein ACPGJR_00030 [Akkermansiaceae bacterium]
MKRLLKVKIVGNVTLIDYYGLTFKELQIERVMAKWYLLVF